jgi:hypothetical protein
MLINGVTRWEPDDDERIEEQTVGGLLREPVTDDELAGFCRDRLARTRCPSSGTGPRPSPSPVRARS